MKKIGNYILEAKLGKGKFGSVYKVSHADTGRIFALKRVNNEKYTTDFAKEISMLSMLDHPNIVSLEYSDPLSRYYVMSYIEGETLEKKITLKDKSDYKQLGYMFSQLLDGVAHMHKQKVLHLDIKPQNILYDKKRGKLYLIDFGIARRTNNNSTSTEGSIYFSSPEMVLNEKIDEQSDIYSLGATLYYVLTQKYLYKKEEINVIEAIGDLYRQPVIPRKYNRNIPPSLEAICLKACQKQRARRYNNVDEYIEDIEVYCRGGSPNIPHKIYSFSDKVISHRYKLVSLGLVILLSMGGYAISSIQSSKLKEQLELIEKKVKLVENIRNEVSHERYKAKIIDDYLTFVASNHRQGRHELLKNKKELDNFFEEVGNQIVKDNRYYISYLKALNYNLNNEVHVSLEEHKGDIRRIVNIFNKVTKTDVMTLEVFKYSGYLDLKERRKILENSQYSSIQNLDDITKRILELKKTKYDVKLFNTIIDSIKKVEGEHFESIKNELYGILFSSVSREIENNLFGKIDNLLNEKRDYRIRILGTFNREIENIGLEMTGGGIPVWYFISHKKKVKSKKGKEISNIFSKDIIKMFELFVDSKYDSKIFKDSYEMYCNLNQLYMRAEKELKEERLDVLYPIIMSMTLNYTYFREMTPRNYFGIDQNEYGTHVYKYNEGRRLSYKQFELKRIMTYLIEKAKYPYGMLVLENILDRTELAFELKYGIDKFPLDLKKDAFYVLSKDYHRYIISENKHIPYYNVQISNNNSKKEIKELIKNFEIIHENLNFVKNKNPKKEDVKKFSIYMNLLRTFYLLDKDESFIIDKYNLFYDENNVSNYLKKAFEYSMYDEESQIMYLSLIDKFEKRKYLNSENDKYMREKFSTSYSYDKKIDSYYFLSSFNIYKIINLAENLLEKKKKIVTHESWEELWRDYFYDGSFKPEIIYFPGDPYKGNVEKDENRLYNKQINILKKRYIYYRMVNYFLQNRGELQKKNEGKKYEEVMKMIKRYTSISISSELDMDERFLKQWKKNG